MSNATNVQIRDYYNGEGYQSWHSASEDAYNFQVGCNSSNTYNFVMCVKFTLSSPANSVTIGLKNNGSWNVGEVHPMRVNISSTDNDPTYRDYKGSSADATFYWTSQYSVASVTVNKKLNAGTYYAYISAWYSGYGAYSEATNKSLSVTYAEAGTYTLNKSQGAGTSLTTTLNSSPFRPAGTALASGATVYGGETVKVSYTASAGYTNATAKYGTTTISSEGTFTVSGNVTVSSYASVLSYKLSISAGTGSTITVNRTSSPKAGASTGTLSNNAIIYYSDVLEITFGTSSSTYSLSDHKVNGSTFTSGNSLTVVGAVSAVSSATLKAYTLTITKDSNSNVVVKRGGETLSSGASVTYGDVLTISFSANVGYSVSTHTVNGSTFTSGGTHTVSGAVTVVASSFRTIFSFTKTQGANTSLSVKRNGVEISSGTILNYGDVLTVTYSASSGYTMSKATINGNKISSGETHTVTSDIAVITQATANPHNLTISEGTNTEVVVMRGAERLYSGSVVSTGDILTIIFNAISGYHITIHNVNGTPFTSGNTHAVSGDVLIVSASATSGSLTQPTNISPDQVNGTGVIDTNQTRVEFSWEVNGNVSMTAFQIQIYRNDVSSTLLYDTDKINLINPFWGRDYLGRVVRYSWEENGVDLRNAGVVNGGEYKLVITQWWSDSDSVSQSTASVFVARSTPSVTVRYDHSLVLDQYFAAEYTQDEGIPINWVRWVIRESSTDGNVVYDTGVIPGTGNLMVEYSGFVPDVSYYVICTVETADGVIVTGNCQYKLEIDESRVFSGNVSVCQSNDNSVKITWDAQSFEYAYAVYRRRSGENYGELANLVFENYTFDYTASSSTSYVYYVFPILSDGTICAPGISEETRIEFTYWEIIEATRTEGVDYFPDRSFYTILKRYYFKFGSGGVSENGFSNNNTPSIVQNFTRYPVRQGSSSLYLTGSVSGLIGDVSNGEYYDSIEQSKKIFDISTSKNALFLRDPEGHLIEIQTSAPIQMTVATKSPKLQKTMTIPWVETGSAEGITFIQ